MSSERPWMTKEDVLKDLAIASGSGLAPVANLDKSNMVIGDAPPPVLHELEEDEMRHQFGDVMLDTGMLEDDYPAPDLQGITNMIRMVQRAEGGGDRLDVSNFGQTSNCVITISKPTKLNPLVKEFVPKGLLSSDSSSSVSEVKTDINATANVDNVEAKYNTPTTSGYVVDVEKETPNVSEDLATKLKNEISNASKSNSFELKKQRNVAIATLLRLYATKDNKSPPKETEPVKLITPDYFENPSPTKELENATQGSTTTTPDSKTLSGSSSDAKSEPALPTQDLKRSPVKPITDPAIKKSIEKVNQWMGAPPVERERPKLFLSPIPFKRKEPIGPVASTSKETEKKVVPKSDNASKYVPTNYAADLVKKYTERSKAKEKQNVNMWTDLDVILKERDAILKKKQLERSRDSNNDSDAPSN